MTARPTLPPLRVEQALRLLPDIDVLAPLRAFLISSSRSRPLGTRTSDEHDRTVGKRYLQPSDLRERIPHAIGQVAAHLTALYEASVAALEAEQRGDLSAAVRALLRAGEREEEVGRYAQSHAWYAHAAAIAEQLRDRRPEIEALWHEGRLETNRGYLDEGARAFQRALALAEAELDTENAARACRGLGDVAFAQSQWNGAESWYTRGLRHAEESPLLTSYLQLSLGEAAQQRGQLETAADRLRLALESFEALGDGEGAIRTLLARGNLEAARGRPADAAASYRTALSRLAETAGKHGELEMATRLRLAELHLETGRLIDAEDEIRRGEELAIAHNFTRQLARLYVTLGKVRGQRHDENGFVFFEKAIELCRGMEPAPRLEADVYREYALFRKGLGHLDEARAYLERAREILEPVADAASLDRIQLELVQLPPL